MAEVYRIKQLISPIWIRILIGFIYLIISTDALPTRQLDETTDHIEYYKILHIQEGFALIGARNYLYNVTIKDMTVQQKFRVEPSHFNQDDNKNKNAYEAGCDAFPEWVAKMDVCHPYVTNVYKHSDTMYEVYASYALRRVRLKLALDNTTNQWTWDIIPSELYKFMTTLFPFQNQSSILSREGVHWNGGGVKLDYNVPCVKVSRGSTGFDENHRSNLDSEYQIWGVADAMFEVNFVGGFETKSHVYFAFTENAAELSVQNFDAQRLTRLLRICKKDRGINREKNADSQEFALFNKVNLNCSASWEMEKNKNDVVFKRANRLTVSVPLNVITGMSELGNGSIIPRTNDTEPEQLFYTMFSAADGDQPASAICAFTLEAVERAFNSYLWGELRLPVTKKTLEDLFIIKDLPDKIIRPYYEFDDKNYPNLTTCYNDTANDSVLPIWIRDFNKRVNLHVDAVNTSSPDPLYFQTNAAQLHHLAVEWQVESVDGKFYDILYSGSADGTLYKFINNGSSFEWSNIEQRALFPGSAFAQLQIAKDKNGDKYLLASSYKKVVQEPLASCSAFKTCQQCVGAQDPHCSWVDTYCATDLKKGIQSISSGWSTACPAVMAANPKPTFDVEEDPVAISIGPFVASVFGGILFGFIIGLLGTYYYIRSQSLSKTPNLDRNLKRKDEGKLSEPFINHSTYAQSSGLYNPGSFERYKTLLVKGGSTIESQYDDSQAHNYESVSPSPTSEDDSRPPSFSDLGSQSCA